MGEPFYYTDGEPVLVETIYYADYIIGAIRKSFNINGEPTYVVEIVDNPKGYDFYEISGEWCDVTEAYLIRQKHLKKIYEKCSDDFIGK